MIFFINIAGSLKDAVDLKGHHSLILSFPLIVRLASPLLPQAERIFLEISNKVLHIYEDTGILFNTTIICFFAVNDRNDNNHSSRR
jgi:hypothetical protein